MTIRPSMLRLAGLAAVLWFMAESALFWLAISTFGLMPTLAFLALKGIGGLVLLTSSLRGVFTGLALNPLTRGLGGIGEAGLVALGAFLIFLPGFAATLAGLALFAPSIRTGVVNWIRREKKASGRDTIITLDAADWRELPDKAANPDKGRRRRKSAVPP